MDTHTPRKNIIDRALSFVESLPIGDRFILKLAVAATVTSVMWLGISVSTGALTPIPDRGGTLREGIVGTPRFINPLLAVTAADRDLAALVYAGIMTINTNGELVPDLAESVTISEDGRVYTVVLRDHITFHDGEPLTTDDVIFTVTRAQDPSLKSPLRASWEGVSTERLSDYEMNFVLPEPYAPFLENLTLGILPEHVWQNATPEEFPFSQYNSEPIGAGAYRIERISRNRSGIPESYELVPHANYHAEEPKIEKLALSFYPNEAALTDAFVRGAIMSAGGLAAESIAAIEASDQKATLYTAPLPRTFALFFNQNEAPVFRDAAVRSALEMVVDRSVIIEQVLGGYGEAVSTPLPPKVAATTTSDEDAPADGRTSLDEARDTLRTGGWRFNTETNQWETGPEDSPTILTFSITTSNAPVFAATAQYLKEQWGALGVPVTIRQFEQADLTQVVIRPRQYETLLFGTAVGRELDLYSFWHSSQRNDPGLNVALYTNITTDALLSKARQTTDRAVRDELYRTFSEELSEEIPAIFLYVPSYTYLVSPSVQAVTISGIADGSERFKTINQWYITQDSVWPFFTD